VASKRSRNDRSNRSSVLAGADVERVNRTLSGINLSRITGTDAVVRPISGFERYLRPSRRLVEMDPTRLSGAVFGLSNDRQSTLFTAFGADSTSRLVKQYVGQNKLFANRASQSLGAMTGAHLRADLAGTFVGALGVDPKQISHLRDALTGKMGAFERLTEKWRLQLSDHPLFGVNAQRNLSRWIDGLRPTLKQMAESAMRFIELRQELDEGAVGFVERHGWPLPLAVPLSVLNRLVRLTDRPKREVTATMLASFGPRTQAFHDSRDAIIESVPFRSRRRAVDQALRAMRRGDQYAAICTMLPLVEGVLVDVLFAGQEPPKWKAAEKAVVELATLDDLEDAWAMRSIETLLLSATGGVALFDRFDRRDYGVPGESRRLNRHAILHGSARRYGTRVNALKLFLLLAALAEVLDDFERQPHE
jgi:hypothetical protein